MRDSGRYPEVVDELGLSEWNPVVWIGRLFTLDNDYGEHWFDNWELREQKKAEAEALGFASEDLMIIDPDRLQNGVDGPCNRPETRKRFWTEVLKSLASSLDFLFLKARERNERASEVIPDFFIEDLERRIEKIKNAA